MLNNIKLLFYTPFGRKEQKGSQDDFLAACSGGKGKTLQAKRENSVDMSYLPGGVRLVVDPGV